MASVSDSKNITFKNTHWYLFLDSPDGTYDTKDKYEIREVYNGNGCLIVQKTFLNNKKHGVWTWRYFNGNYKKQVVYVKGNTHGKHITWHENGQVKRILTYVMNTIHGEVSEWDKNGNHTNYRICMNSKIIYELQYLKDNYDSRSCIETGDYNKSMMRIKKSTFGKKNIWRCRINNNDPDNIVHKGIFKKNLWLNFPEMKSLNYHEFEIRESYTNNGDNTICIETYVDNKKHGVFTSWYSSGNPKKQERYHEGMLHGYQVMCHPNGVSDSLVPYVLGEKHGVVHQWDTEGKHRSTYIYIKNSLFYYRYYLYDDDGTYDNLYNTIKHTNVRLTNRMNPYIEGGKYGYKKCKQILKESGVCLPRYKWYKK